MSANTQSVPTTSHRLGFMQHSKITGEIGAIDANKKYTVTDIPPNGSEITTVYVGSDIRKRYSEIFGKNTHGFIVTPAGGRIPVFVYEGPIRGRVDTILASLH